ncbi:transmembrane protein 127-like [Hyla sarda]|uniref:transmembrane protein 127-like n=1 Tax=Hyla sarda TaxID=327740 RepID=UPI0024C3E536|nr:transmembrane protein 127-like [Hyla sarda]
MAQRGGRAEGEAFVSSGRSPVPERCLAAALIQGLGVVCACTALADPAWLLVMVEGKNYVYGAAYILHLGFNLTEPSDAHHLLHKSGLYVLVLLSTCCYLSILLGVSAFLLDFLGTRYMRIKSLGGILLPPILHFTTVLSSAAAVALCTYLYVFLHREVLFQLIKAPANTLSLGESYYFTIAACLASIGATAFSLQYARKYSREDRTFTAALETGETSPLLQEPETPDPPGEYG